MRISQNISELSDFLTAVSLYSPDRFPADYSMDYETAFEALRLSLKSLEKKIGKERCSNLLDMAEQAKLYFDQGQVNLATWLMQDMEQYLNKKKLFAYPSHLWRWD